MKSFVDPKTGFYVVTLSALEAMIWDPEGGDTRWIAPQIVSWFHCHVKWQNKKEAWYRYLAQSDMVDFGFKHPDMAALFKLTWG